MKRAIRARRRSDPVPRFWEKVEKRDDGCWLWKGCTLRGYGLYRVVPGQPMVKAHRLSYEWAKGPVPAGMVVMHSCDVKGCVNPAHLSVGQQKENVRQAVARNLMPRGEQKPQRKLSQAQVVEIRARAAAGESVAVLAREYGISSPNAQSIVHRRKWRHVA